eukprot:TRINITY_DN60751_c0_g1_i1.p1 TRINITY_DN60751_c0_g1~~TRINITY_DN60751_c0_g1_i1.p1  ORF type:complete len:1809 (-),score=251.75 TRINITY_DN60751_c0_g1_i1:69-5465(-)
MAVMRSSVRQVFVRVSRGMCRPSSLASSSSQRVLVACVAMAFAKASLLVEQPFQVAQAGFCIGDQREYQRCADNPVCGGCIPVNCSWGNWNNWASMGRCYGLCQRSRSVSTANNECGRPCDGAAVETKACLQHEDWLSCTNPRVDCHFSAWSNWGSCSGSPLGQSLRSREVEAVPSIGGALCLGSFKETRFCFTGTRNRDCEFTSWTEWAICSKSCGGGASSRIRTVATQAAGVGKRCSGAQMEQKSCETQLCNTFSKDCEVESWSVWAGCDAQSPTLRTRTRKTTPLFNTGIPCSDAIKQVESCHVGKPQDLLIDCQLTQWSSWQACDVSCGGGQSFRHRAVGHEAETCAACPHRSMNMTKSCNEQICPSEHPQKDCLLGDWADWSQCSSACGTGVRTTERVVSRFLVDDGESCSGTLKVVSGCIVECEKVDCEWGSWDAWTVCSRTCGGGTSSRHRSVKEFPKRGGKPCEPLRKGEITVCATQRCEVCVDGRWSAWSSWGHCSSSCDGGVVFRQRVMQTRATACGTPATGLSEEYRACDGLPPCVEAVDCKLNHWTQWGACSSSCFGMRERSRNIANYHKGTGKTCVNETLMELRPCNPSDGEVPSSKCVGLSDEVSDCVFSEWTTWSTCPVSCGGAQSSRSRTIVVPARNGISDGTHLVPMLNFSNVVCNNLGGVGPDTDCDGLRIRHVTTFKKRSVDLYVSADASYIAESANEIGSINGGKMLRVNIQGPLSTQLTFAFFDSETKSPVTLDRIVFSVVDLDGVRLSVQNTLYHQRFSLDDATEVSVDKQVDKLEFWSSEVSGEAADVPENPLKLTPSQRRNVVELVFENSQQFTLGLLSKGGRSVLFTGPTELTCEDPEECRMQTACVGVTEATRACADHVCPGDCIDCTWGMWSEWGGCQKCGGEQTRTRSILTIGNSCGMRCQPGHAKEVMSCPSDSCSSQGYWCVWGDWSTIFPCMSHCSGAETRLRSLSAVAQQPESYVYELSKTSSTCFGQQTLAVACTDPTGLCTDHCNPVPCLFSEWHEWETPTCLGLSERVRTIQQINNECGKPCEGPLIETQKVDNVCDKQVPCVISDWSEWTSCNGTNGLPRPTQAYRGREVTQNPRNGAPSCEGNLREVRVCADEPPQDCQVSSWSNWLPCSETCGGGYRLRHREPSSVAHGGKPCQTVLQELQSCNEACCLVKSTDCVLSAWADWSDCQVDVMKYRTRSFETEASDGGTGCVGNLKEAYPCGQERQDCVMSDWMAFSPCSKTCGGGQMTVNRKQLKYAKNGGKICPFSILGQRPCNTQTCHDSTDCAVSDWAPWTVCSSTCGLGQTARSRDVVTFPTGLGKGCDMNLTEVNDCTTTPCDVTNCIWNTWSSWTACTQTCDGGHRERARGILHPAKKGGLPCAASDMRQVEGCNMKPCNEMNCIDGEWDEWTHWGDCSRTCEGGLHFRKRVVFSHANHCGKEVIGNAREAKGCNLGMRCAQARDCTFREWEAWGSCVRFNSESCQGRRTRYREVDQAGVFPGNMCDGIVDETTECRVPEYPELGIVCPNITDVVDCQLSEWSSWSVCASSCGSGNTFRNRNVTVPPLNNGRRCEGVMREVKECALSQECPKNEPRDCVWGDWDEWSVCGGCGKERLRSRQVEVMPAFGGKGCAELATQEIGSCQHVCRKNEGRDPKGEMVWCSWKMWSDWSSCSSSCGEAQRRRERSLTIVADPDLQKGQQPFSRLFDTESVEREYMELQQRANQLRNQRAQELVMGFASGAVLLIALITLPKLFGRRFRRTREFSRDTVYDSLRHAGGEAPVE